MAITDLKFTEGEFVNNDISSLPNQVTGQAAFLKAKFDNIGKNMVALGKFNALINALVATNSAQDRSFVNVYLVDQTKAHPMHPLGRPKPCWQHFGFWCDSSGIFLHNGCYFQFCFGWALHYSQHVHHGGFMMLKHAFLENYVEKSLSTWFVCRPVCVINKMIMH